MASKTNPIYTTKNRASGTTIELHDLSLEAGWQLRDPKWHTRCAEHDEVKVFQKQADAYKAMTKPVWCTGCAKIMEGSEERREAAKESFQAFAKVATKKVLEEEHPRPPVTGKEPKLTNHQKMQQNICTECGGPLRAQDGHYHEKRPPLGAVCCNCRGHVIGNVQQDQQGTS